MDVDTEDAGDGLRDILADAIATDGQPEVEAPAPATAPEDTSLTAEADPTGSTGDATPAPDEAESSTTGRDKSGRFAKTTLTPAPKAATPAVTQAPTNGAKTGTAPPQAATGTATAPEVAKAPQSWKPEAREAWAAIPPAAQAEIVRRDREVAGVLQSAAQKSRFGEAVQSAVGPYEAQIRAEGSDPVRAIGSLLQTAQALRTAPPQHKAQLVAHMIKSYGIPVEMLAAALDGEPMQGQQGQQNGQGYVDPQAIAQQVEQRILSQFQAQRAQGLANRARDDISKFSEGKEFFDDVREHMADLLEVAARRGISLTAEDAYNRACQLEPQVSAVLKQRALASQANVNNASTQRTRAAGSSVRSQPAGVSAEPQQTDIRSSIQAAIRERSGR